MYARISNSDGRISIPFWQISNADKRIANTDTKILRTDEKIELTERKSLAGQGFFSFTVSSFILYFGRENSNPLTCLNWGEVAPNTDLTYFFTSKAVSTKPVFSAYKTMSREIIELLYAV